MCYGGRLIGCVNRVYCPLVEYIAKVCYKGMLRGRVTRVG